MTIYESGENYLEAIWKLSQNGERVLAVDIARELGFSKPSVTRALNVLAGKGLLLKEPKNIKLTPEGQKLAKEITERHNVITKFLLNLGIPQEIAQTDACRIEHYISPETFNAFYKATLL